MFLECSLTPISSGGGPPDGLFLQHSSSFCHLCMAFWSGSALILRPCQAELALSLRRHSGFKQTGDHEAAVRCTLSVSPFEHLRWNQSHLDYSLNYSLRNALQSKSEPKGRNVFLLTELNPL